MNKSTHVTNSLEETQKIASNLAEKLSRHGRGKTSATVVALKGELGGGKTSFTQGFAKGLDIKEKVNSPTFNIFKKFKFQNSNFKSNLKLKNYKTLYHFDCYRIEDEKEILDLGFEEIISDPKNIILIEWADKIKKILPKDTLWINFEFIDTNTRKITFK